MPRIVVTEPGPGAAESIRAQLSGPDFEIVGYARDGLEAAQMALRQKADVLLVHEDLPGLSGYRACQLVTAATADVPVVILVAQDNEGTLRRAMTSGARAVCPLNAPAGRLADVVREVAGLLDIRQEPEFPVITDPRRMPVSIAVTAARGGAGKTTVAVNLAVLFAKRFPNEVALVELSGQFGDVALALDLAASGSLAELMQFDELDQDLVLGQLTPHPASTLRVLANTGSEGHTDVDYGRLSVPFMASLIGLLRRSFRFVFFDMPPLVWPISSYVLSRCQRVLIVSLLADLHGIRNARTLIEAVNAGAGDPGRIRLIANRTSRRGDYNIQDMESLTGQAVYQELPDDAETACGALNTGVPVVLEAPNTGLAKALSRLSERLLAEL